MTWKRAIPTILACIVLAVAIFALGARISSGDINDNTRQVNNNTEQVHRLTVVVENLQAARDRDKCQARANAAAFAVVLHSLADNFSTPPYPDPARIAAVDKMNATADFFDSASKSSAGTDSCVSLTK